MERIPQFIDNLDSAFYALRLAWPGHLGRLVLFLSISALSVFAMSLSPLARTFGVSIIGSFASAELLYRFYLAVAVAESI